MHILIANRWYPPESNGGVAVYNYNLAHGLLRLGHSVSIITSIYSEKNEVVRETNGVKFIPISLPQYSRTYRVPILRRFIREYQQFVYSVKVAGTIGHLPNSEVPDIVEFAEINAEGFAYLLRRSRHPVVVRCHTPTFVLRDHYAKQEMSYDTNLTVFMEKKCIYRADGLSAPSQNMASVVQKYCRKLGTEIKPIANPIDTTLYADRSISRTMGNRDDIVILHVGRLERVKGIWVLAEAIAKTIRNNVNIKLLLVGGDRKDGQGRSNLEQLKSFFAGEGISNKIRFLIDADQDELLDCYAEADIAVVPTVNYESFSYTCAQAMSASLPVIASRIGGIPETVDDGENGILVKPGDAEDLAKAIMVLVEDASLRRKMGEKGRIKAVSSFDSLVVARKTTSFYETFL